MTLVNRIVWFCFAGAYLRGRVTKQSSGFVTVVVNNDGPHYAQVVSISDLMLNPPDERSVTQEAQP